MSLPGINWSWKFYTDVFKYNVPRNSENSILHAYVPLNCSELNP